MSLARRHRERIEARLAGKPEPARVRPPASAEALEGEAVAQTDEAILAYGPGSRPTLAARKRMAALGAAVVAAAANDNAAGGPVPEATAYQLMLAQLGQHLRDLKKVQSMEARADFKRRILPEYGAYVEGWLSQVHAGHAPVQDEVVATYLIWCIDVGEFEMALLLGELFIAHGLRLPERFQRTPAAFLVEQVAEAAVRAYATGQAFDADLLARLERTTGRADMPDEVRAQLFKALGLAYAEVANRDPADAAAPEGQPEVDIAGQRQSACNASLGAFRRALELDQRAGVKKDIERMERLAKSLAAPPT